MSPNSVEPNASCALTKQDFMSRKLRLDSINSTLSDDFDIKRIEQSLDLESGLLSGHSFQLENYDCECGRKLTFYDFVATALHQHVHDKDLIINVLSGPDYHLNSRRYVDCTECGATSLDPCGYGNDYYGCDLDPPLEEKKKKY